MASRILLADDEKTIRTICSRALSRLGHKVDVVENGAQALRHIKEQDYDLVITDISMPGDIDGTEVVAEVKRLRPLTDVLVMTAFPALDTALPTLKKGAFDYLIKPFDRDVFESVVQRCLDKRRLNDELHREQRLRGELQAAYAELQELSQLKEGFLARLNHELRIPLTPALLAIDLLDKSSPDDKTHSLCELARRRLQQLQALIEDLLSYSRIRQGDADYPKGTVPLRKTLVAIVEQLCCEWQERSIKVEVDIDKTVNGIAGSPPLLETAFRHLFLNAVRFNRKGGMVRIRVVRSESNIEIQFSDTGAGIPKEKLNKVFDSFYQVADYLTREVGGVGLGLAMVKRIVEMHGGSITVSSQEGHGSTFKMVLPEAA